MPRVNLWPALSGYLNRCAAAQRWETVLVARNRAGVVVGWECGAGLSRLRKRHPSAKVQQERHQDDPRASVAHLPVAHECATAQTPGKAG